MFLKNTEREAKDLEIFDDFTRRALEPVRQQGYEDGIMSPIVIEATSSSEHKSGLEQLRFNSTKEQKRLLKEILSLRGRYLATMRMQHIISLEAVIMTIAFGIWALEETSLVVLIMLIVWLLLVVVHNRISVRSYKIVLTQLYYNYGYQEAMEQIGDYRQLFGSPEEYSEKTKIRLL